METEIMDRFGTARTTELGKLLLVAFVIGVALCVVRYAVETVLTLGASASTGRKVDGMTALIPEQAAQALQTEEK